VLVDIDVPKSRGELVGFVLKDSDCL
jgi:hypothetical protein